MKFTVANPGLVSDRGYANQCQYGGMTNTEKMKISDARSEKAIQLRAEGKTWREISDIIGLDPSYLALKVKNYLAKQKGHS